MTKRGPASGWNRVAWRVGCAALVVLASASWSRSANARRRVSRAQVEQLVRMVRDGPAAARNRAAQRLYHLRDPRGMAAIVRLARHKAPALRAVGVWALSVVRPPGAAKILIARARDKHVGVRRNAVIGLGNLRVAAGARVLRKRLFDRNPLIRSAAVRSLSLLGGRGVSGLALAVRRGDPDLKLLAVTALGRMKHRRARRLLRRCARVGEPAVRALAAGELIDDGDPAGSRAAIRLLARGNPRGARLQAAQLLGRGRTKAGERALKRALHDANANVRQAAANALAERRARKK